MMIRYRPRSETNSSKVALLYSALFSVLFLSVPFPSKGELGCMPFSFRKNNGKMEMIHPWAGDCAIALMVNFEVR